MFERFLQLKFQSTVNHPLVKKFLQHFCIFCTCKLPKKTKNRNNKIQYPYITQRSHCFSPKRASKALQTHGLPYRLTPNCISLASIPSDLVRCLLPSRASFPQNPVASLIKHATDASLNGMHLYTYVCMYVCSAPGASDWQQPDPVLGSSIGCSFFLFFFFYSILACSLIRGERNGRS